MRGGFIIDVRMPDAYIICIKSCALSSIGDVIDAASAYLPRLPAQPSTASARSTTYSAFRGLGWHTLPAVASSGLFPDPHVFRFPVGSVSDLISFLRAPFLLTRVGFCCLQL